MSDPLTPAEAAFLLKPSSSSAAQCLQAALLTLLDRGYLELGETGTFFNEKTLRLKRGDLSLLPEHLSEVMTALSVFENGPVLTSSEVARALQRTFGAGYDTYIHEVLAPDVIRRGLVMREERKLLWLIPYTKYEHTPLGRARADRIAKLMDELGNLGDLLRRSPMRAEQLAKAAGVLLVLSPAARAHAATLKAMLQRNDNGDGGAGSGGG